MHGHVDGRVNVWFVDGWVGRWVSGWWICGSREVGGIEGRMEG